ncbi:MAG: hypothetical protein ABI367_14370 [Mucilaginibacter sp.]
MKKIIIVLLVVLAGCHSDKPTVPFTILKVVKADGGVTKMDILIPGRLERQQMLDIAAKVKRDSSQYDNLQIDYLLPGNSYKNSGGVIVYATAAYHPQGKTTARDTVKDYNDKPLSFDFNGITRLQAGKLLAVEPAEMVGKTLLGRFIDDDLKTMILVYEDKADNQKYILELDTTGKIIAPIIPKIVNQDGISKMVITEHGDYMTLKDSILTMYSGLEPEKPYRTLKKGI